MTLGAFEMPGFKLLILRLKCRFAFPIYQICNPSVISVHVSEPNVLFLLIKQGTRYFNHH